MLGNLIRFSLLAYAWSLVIPVIAGAVECEVTIGFTEEVSASGILVDVAYPASGGFVGVGDSVSCRTNVSGGIATVDNQTEDGVLTSALIRIDSFSGADLLSCAWTGAAVAASDFVVSTLDATNSRLETIDRFPSIGSIEGPTDLLACGFYPTDDQVDSIELESVQIRSSVQIMVGSKGLSSNS